MNSPLQNIVKAQITNLSGLHFENFIVFLMRLHYGNHVIQEIRNTKDEGADCLIDEFKICIACYAPEKKVTPAAIKKKMTDDFGSYQRHWQSQYPDWHFYTNLDPSPAQIRLVHDWGERHKVRGCEHILSLIEIGIDGKARTFPQKHRIYNKLSIDKEYLGRDFLKMLFDDLQNQTYADDEVDYSKEAPQIIRKIQANSNETELAEFKSMFNATFELQFDIEQALSAYDWRDINTIKNRIINDYYKNGIPGISEFQKMKQLIKHYEARYNSEMDDDLLSAYIAALVWYAFSQCQIGVPPKEE